MTSSINVSLPRSQPEALGIDSKGIERFLAAISSSGVELHSFMLLRHGKVAAEGWWNPYSADLPHALYSVSKSFTSTAVGFAVQEKLLTVDDLIISFFPEDLPEKISPYLERLAIKHLLMMASGHTQDTIETMNQQPEGNWVKAFLGVPLEKEPGTHFLYNNGATYMVSAIIQKVSGQTVLDYLGPRLFAPLGIINPHWDTCPRGISAGGFGLSLTTEDIAKLGLLYLQQGVWNGERLLDEEWIQAATTKQIANGDNPDSDWNQGYGYQFWQCRHHAYRGDGFFGQFCLVMPEQQAVIAITGAQGDTQLVLNTIWDHLLPAMKPETLAANEIEAERIAVQLRELAILPPHGLDFSDNEELMNGKIYKFEDPQGWISFSVAFTGNEAVITMVHKENSYTIRAGRSAWLAGRSNLIEETDLKVVSSFTWKDEDTFEYTIRFIETAILITVEVKMDGQTIALKEKVNVVPDTDNRDAIIGRI
ncbi:serine hydrolase domain-containing protein [Paenibacillus sp. GCM10012306]|uniref:serine hydrolase domain-containing protein n=1 Tax=Paenibacillus sp. GCM10012306 TaxID=3317342 RepID=UPI00360D7161